MPNIAILLLLNFKMVSILKVKKALKKTFFIFNVVVNRTKYEIILLYIVYCIIASLIKIKR